METLYIPNESDFKRWIKEAVREFFENSAQKEKPDEQNGEGLLNRKEIARFLRISLVTLTDWISRGYRHINKEVGFTLTEMKCWIISRKKRCGRYRLALSCTT